MLDLVGEVIGLGRGNRDRCAAGGVLTGNDGTGRCKNFFGGVAFFDLGIIVPTALRVFDLRMVEAG